MTETKKEYELTVSFSSREDAEDIRDTLTEDLGQHGRDHSLIMIKEIPTEEPENMVEIIVNLESFRVMVPQYANEQEIRCLVNQKLEHLRCRCLALQSSGGKEERRETEYEN